MTINLLASKSIPTGWTNLLPWNKLTNQQPFAFHTQHIPLPSASIDLLFTDPPYNRQSLPTYAWIAAEAERLLKPGAFVAVMCGGLHLNHIFRIFNTTALHFYYLYSLGLAGHRSGLVWRHSPHGNMPIAVRSKHILVFSQGPAVTRTASVDLYWAKGPDKHFHTWGQDTDSHRYYIDILSAHNDLILDPMAGGGTSIEACNLLGRRCIAGDLDPAAIHQMQARTTHIVTGSAGPGLRSVAIPLATASAAGDIGRDTIPQLTTNNRQPTTGHSQ